MAKFRFSPLLQARAAPLHEGSYGCDDCVSLIPTVMLAGQTGSAIRGASSSQPRPPPFERGRLIRGTKAAAQGPLDKAEVPSIYDVREAAAAFICLCRKEVN